MQTAREPWVRGNATKGFSHIVIRVQTVHRGGGEEENIIGTHLFGPVHPPFEAHLHVGRAGLVLPPRSAVPLPQHLLDADLTQLDHLLRVLSSSGGVVEALFEVRRVLGLVRQDERVRRSLRAGARRTTDSVHIFGDAALRKEITTLEVSHCSSP